MAVCSSSSEEELEQAFYEALMTALSEEGVIPSCHSDDSDEER